MIDYKCIHSCLPACLSAFLYSHLPLSFPFYFLSLPSAPLLYHFSFCLLNFLFIYVCMCAYMCTCASSLAYRGQRTVFVDYKYMCCRDQFPPCGLQGSNSVIKFGGRCLYPLVSHQFLSFCLSCSLSIVFLSFHRVSCSLD